MELKHNIVLYYGKKKIVNTRSGKPVVVSRVDERVMPFTYYGVIHSEVDPIIRECGIVLFRSGAVAITRSRNNGCEARVIDDNQLYKTWIGFHRIGSPKQTCDCVAYSYDCICEHIIATALEYDESRGVGVEQLIGRV